MEGQDTYIQQVVCVHSSCFFLNVKFLAVLSLQQWLKREKEFEDKENGKPFD